ncbi:MAG: gamma-glutamylcyclotransferase family protein, partial [Segetibacter sp.]
PAAIPTAGGFFIKGELYKLKNASEFEYAMKQLDDYEGLNPGEGEKPLYIRKVTEILCNNQYTNAWIYWYNLCVDGQLIISSGDFFDYLTYKTKQ